MKKTSNIFTFRNTPLYRGSVGIIAAFLILVKLSSPFLHTHQFEQAPQKSVSISAAHCDACEYESTQAIQPAAAIVLPSDLFSYEVKVYETSSIFVNTLHSSSESRGPPQFS